jgi:hypothetical protein
MPASAMPILMLEGPYQADDLPLFAELELTPVLHTMWQVDALIDSRLPQRAAGVPEAQHRHEPARLRPGEFGTALDRW